MNRQTLEGQRVAVLATDGFEQSELLEPVKALRERNANVHVVSPKSGKIRGWKDGNWADSIDVDRSIDEASANDYDALVLPGGTMNPDKLRMNDKAVQFVKQFFMDGKPVAAICHGPQILIDADVLHGREVTSYASLKNDLKNAGAKWVDRECVCDQGLVTSRTPADLPAFIEKMIEEIHEGFHAGQRTA